MNAKDHFIASFVEESRRLNGTEFEQLCTIVFSLILKHEVEQKGHNIYLKPVKGLDLVESDNVGIIGQAGTDEDYFTYSQIEKSKPIKDIEGTRKYNPNCKELYLFSNKEQTSKQQVTLQTYITNNYTKKIHIYDSRRIANIICDNFACSDKVMSALTNLPMSLYYFVIFFLSYQIPNHHDSFFERKEYDNLVDLLKEHDVVQVSGISGIGKTELAIHFANMQKDNYHAVLWIDGDNYGKDITSIHNARSANPLNLCYLLNTSRLLVVVDNLNVNQSSFIDDFNKANKYDSKCIITTLSPDTSHKQICQLSALDREASKNILLYGLNEQDRPSDEQLDKILLCINGYALLLRLIRSNVDNKYYTWQEIVDALSDITSIDDNDSHQEVARRIIGKHREEFFTEFSFLCTIGSTHVSKDFFDKQSNIFKIKKLEDIAILHNSLHYYAIHQIILDSISHLFKDTTDNNKNYKALCDYLKKNIDDKTDGFYDLMYRNKKFISTAHDSIASNDDKKVIVYAMLQAYDTFSKPVFYKNLIDSCLTPDSNDKFDVLLYVEKLEIELNQLKGSDNYKEQANSFATDLMQRLNDSLSSDMKSIFLHHAGKFYNRAGNNNDAIQCYEKVLNQDPNAYYTLLQLGRSFQKNKDINGVINCVKKLFEIGEDNIPLSILLSSYELIYYSQRNDLKDIYILNRTEVFKRKMLYCISIENNQVLGTLSKLSSYLQFKMKNVFCELVEALPVNVNISNADHSTAFSYAEIRLFQYKSFDNKDSDEANLIFRLSKESFLTSQLNNDYERKRLSDLYVEAGLYKDVLEMENQFENKNEPFYCMNKAKAYCGLTDYDKALENIDISLNATKQQKHFIGAFQHCKASILYKMKDPLWENVMNTAIQNQTDKDTISLWQNELAEWKKNNI